MTTILIIDDHRNQKNPGEEGEIEGKKHNNNQKQKKYKIIKQE